MRSSSSTSLPGVSHNHTGSLSTLRRANDHSSSQPLLNRSLSRRRPSKTKNSELAAVWAVSTESSRHPPTPQELASFLRRENSGRTDSSLRRTSLTAFDSLDIKYARTPEEVVSAIAKHQKAIKCTRVNIGPKDVPQIAKVLCREYCFDLQYLDFTGNVLGSPGTRRLLEPLLVEGATPKLAKLSLENNDLDAEAGVWIAQVLEVSHCPLQSLILGRNRLGPSGGQRIADALSVNRSMIELDMSQNSLDLPVGMGIIRSMRSNPKHRLQKIDLSENGLPSELDATFQALLSFSASLWSGRRFGETLKEASALCPGQRVKLPFLFDYLGAISDHWGNEEQVKHIIAALHAPIATFRHFVNRRGPTLAAAEYNVDRIHHLAKLYVPQEKVTLPSDKISTQGLFVLNLTPFTAIFRLVESNSKVAALSGASIQIPELSAGYKESIEVTMHLSGSEVAPVQLIRDHVCVALEVGENRHTLDDSIGAISGHLRTLFSMKNFESFHSFVHRTACMLTLVWAPPARLSGIRLNDLMYEWKRYQTHQNLSRKLLPSEPTMYDAVQSWVKPETGPSQSSFAALCEFGPVETFVSHWWGSPFEQTLDALHRHDCTGAQRVWVCSFANNQWRVKAELGDDVYLSPFRQALVCDSCTCMALMLDTDGAPLRRYWCLYEIMTAISLQKEGRPMSLDLCTPKGVINRKASGSVPVEYNLTLASMLAKIDVAHAACREQRDREMITVAINEHLGGFEKMNQQIRECIEEGLHIMYEDMTDQFRTTHTTLGLGVREYSREGRSFDSRRVHDKGEKAQDPVSPGMASCVSPLKVDSSWPEDVNETTQIGDDLVSQLRADLAATRKKNKELQEENSRCKSECFKLRQELAAAKAVSRWTHAAGKAAAAPARRNPGTGSARRTGNSPRSVAHNP